MRVDLRDVHSLEHDAEFLRVLTDMIGATVFWEGRLCVLCRLCDLSQRETPALTASPTCAARNCSNSTRQRTGRRNEATLRESTT